MRLKIVLQGSAKRRPGGGERVVRPASLEIWKTEFPEKRKRFKGLFLFPKALPEI